MECIDHVQSMPPWAIVPAWRFSSNRQMETQALPAFPNTPPPFKKHVADTCRLHPIRLHPASRLVDAPVRKNDALSSPRHVGGSTRVFEGWL
jgi:hypothetical protein